MGRLSSEGWELHINVTVSIRRVIQNLPLADWVIITIPVAAVSVSLLSKLGNSGFPFFPFLSTLKL